MSFNLRLAFKIELLLDFISKSNIVRLYPADWILLSDDSDKNFNLEEKKYSVYEESIAYYLITLGYKTISICKSTTVFKKSQTYSNSISLNKEFVKVLFFKLFGVNKETELWVKILNKVNPRGVIAIQPSSGLCMAGKIIGIPVFDLQHGIIEPSVYYNQSLTKFFGNNGLPTGVLCWDFPSVIALHKALPNVKAFNIGNFWINRFLLNKSKDIFVHKEKERVKRIYVAGSDVILVTLQWNSRKPKIIEIPKLVAKTLKLLVLNGWVIWVKFHPVQKQKIAEKILYFEWEKVTDISFNDKNIKDVSEFALPALLPLVKLNITGYSASAIEASLMNIPSLLWNNDLIVKEWFQYYIDKGIVSLLNDDLNDIFVNILKNKFYKIINNNIINDDDFLSNIDLYLNIKI